MKRMAGWLKMPESTRGAFGELVVLRVLVVVVLVLARGTERVPFAAR